MQEVVDLNNAVVWMVSTLPIIFKSSSLFNNPSATVPRSLITIGIIVTFMFPGFFYFLTRSRYLSFFSFSFNYIQWSAGTSKSSILQVIFCSWLLLDLVVWPRLSDPFIYQNPTGVRTFHSPGQMFGCACAVYSDGQISISCTIPNGSLFNSYYTEE